MVTSINPTGRRVGYNFYFWSNSISINYRAEHFNHLNFIFYVEKLFNKFFRLITLLTRGRFQPRLSKFNSNFFGFGNKSFLINLELFDYTWLNNILRTRYRRIRKKGPISKRIFSLLGRYRYFVSNRRKKLLNLRKKYLKYLKLRNRKFLGIKRRWYRRWLRSYKRYKGLKKLKLRKLRKSRKSFNRLVLLLKNPYLTRLLTLYKKLSILKSRKKFKNFNVLGQAGLRFKRLARKIFLLNRFILVRNKKFGRLSLLKNFRKTYRFKRCNIMYTKDQISDLQRHKFLKVLLEKKPRKCGKKLQPFTKSRRKKKLFRRRIRKLKKMLKRSVARRRRLVVRNYSMYSRRKYFATGFLCKNEQRYIYFKPKSKSSSIILFNTDKTCFTRKKIRVRNRRIMRQVRRKKLRKIPKKRPFFGIDKMLMSLNFFPIVIQGLYDWATKPYSHETYKKIMPIFHPEVMEEAIKAGIIKPLPTSKVKKPILTATERRLLRIKRAKEHQLLKINSINERRFLKIKHAKEQRLLKFKRVFLKGLKRSRVIMTDGVLLGKEKRNYQSKNFRYFFRKFKHLLNSKTLSKTGIMKIRMKIKKVVPKKRRNKKITSKFSKLIKWFKVVSKSGFKRFKVSRSGKLIKRPKLKSRSKLHYYNSRGLRFYNRLKNKFKTYLKNLTYYSKNRWVSRGFVRLMKSRRSDRSVNFFKNRFNSWFFLKNFKKFRFIKTKKENFKSVSELKFNKIRFSINSLLLDKINALIKIRIKFLSSYIKHGIFNVFNKYFSLFYNFSKNFILEILVRHDIDIGLTAKFIVHWIKLKFRRGFRINSILHGLSVAFQEFPRLAGYKICLSGRFTRKQIATYQWTKSGRVLLTVQNSIIDYGSIRMITRFGVCGIKLWLHNLS